jgi:hypothetical protein
MPLAAQFLQKKVFASIFDTKYLGWGAEFAK